MSVWGFFMVLGWGIVLGILFAPRPKPRPCYEISSIAWATVLRRNRRAARPSTCDPRCGDKWTPGFCDPDCPSADLAYYEGDSQDEYPHPDAYLPSAADPRGERGPAAGGE